MAWIDCLARGRSLGRSVLEFGDHAGLDDLPVEPAHPTRALRFRPFDRAQAPPWAPSGLLNRWTVAAFNELWYRKAPRRQQGHLVPAARFFHPLDAGRRVEPHLRPSRLPPVPDGRARRRRGDAAAVDRGAEPARCASFLAVLKRFGPANPGAAVVPPVGLDAGPRPAGRRATGLAPLLDRLDEMVVAPVAGSTWPRTPGCGPSCWKPCIPSLPRLAGGAGPARTPTAGSARTWPAGFRACSIR